MTEPLLRLAPPRRRAVDPRVVVLGMLLLGTLAIAWLAGPVGLGDEDPGAEPAATARAAPATAAVAVQEQAGTSTRVASLAAQQPLGTVAGLELWIPASQPLVVSYHEASFPEAQAIAPAGTPGLNENATRQFEVTGGAGPEYLVQVSRGRAQGPTTAVDVVLPADTPVLAPVAGVVTEVRPYRLYGEHDDVRIELRPDDAPRLRVVLIHVDGVDLAAGDPVAVGDVLADRARTFPFEAVVDRATAPERHGHVHLEVKRPAPADVDPVGGDGSQTGRPAADG